MRVMAVPGKYGVGLRWRVRRMVLGAGRAPESSRGGAVKRVADRWGVRLEALRTWARQAETDDGVRPGTMSGDTARIAESGREARWVAAGEGDRDLCRVLRGRGARRQDQAGRHQVPAAVVECIDTRRGRVVEGRPLGAEPIRQAPTDSGARIAPSTHRAATPGPPRPGRHETPNSSPRSPPRTQRIRASTGPGAATLRCHPPQPGHGRPISPTPAPTPAGPASRSCWTRSPRWSWADRCRPARAPTRPRTPSTRGPRPGPATTSPAWSITTTGARDTERFATPSGSPKPRPRPRSAPRTTATTTPWPRRRTRRSRPSASATRR